MEYQNCKLYGISNKKYLSELLRIDVFKLKDIDRHFSTDFYISKSRNKERHIYPPKPYYKKILKRLNSFLSRITLPDFVNGGIKNKSYIMNGSYHINNNHFLLLDIKNFYPSTSDYFVYRFFKNRLNMSTDIAKICTLLVTEPHPMHDNYRHLPQGYPTSSLLSFLVYSDMYIHLYNYAMVNNITFTCFVDDLTFSSNDYISKSFKRNISKIVRQFNLEINSGKTMHRKINKGINITGTYIKENKLFAPNRLQKDLSTAYSKLCTAYEANPKDINQLKSLCNQLQGYIVNVELIEEARSLDYMQNMITKVRRYIKNKA
ncbi:reverse transcriptase family protein [Bacillus sp. UMB0728]|uniref:reverse transcriptase family protein n=1 Tax=Bacillus sp. UMB0728 TaxID=2066052 RepID=UPI000C7726C0|nr:reverse transcriptase family protein [Bacillus sp. UMB0728]PLR71034.1 hypothetical protein CYJ37_19800 [Bacillus sp. UMB0728]